MQQMAHQDGEVPSAMTLSTSSNYSIEDVAGHNENLFFQLYFRSTENMLKKTKDLDLKVFTGGHN